MNSPTAPFARFVKAAPEGGSGQHVTDFANRAAELNAEAKRAGADSVYAYVARMCDHYGDDLDPQMIAEGVGDLLAQGADDDWSGRCNDVRRAYHDGVRQAAREVLQAAFNG